MASIKDVAAKAQVSISTVSIIINGKSKERKISKNELHTGVPIPGRKRNKRRRKHRTGG